MRIHPLKSWQRSRRWGSSNGTKNKRMIIEDEAIARHRWRSTDECIKAEGGHGAVKVVPRRTEFSRRMCVRAANALNVGPADQ